MADGKVGVSWDNRLEGIRASMDPVYGIVNKGEDHLRKAFALMEGQNAPPELTQTLDKVGSSLLKIKEALGTGLSRDGMYIRLGRALVNPTSRQFQKPIWDQLEDLLNLAVDGYEALQSLDGIIQQVAKTSPPEVEEALKSKIKDIQGVYDLLGGKIHLGMRCFDGQWVAVRDATSPPRGVRNNQERS